MQASLPCSLLFGMAVGLLLCGPAYAREIPQCRLDAAMTAEVKQVVESAVATFKLLGRDLGIESVAVNPSSPGSGAGVLKVYIVRDAAADAVTAQGCLVRPPRSGEKFDAMSVQGGCVVVATEQAEIRCSAGAVALFGDVGRRSGQVNPSLLYVMAHELGHLRQRRVGEYSGRTERIDLSLKVDAKLEALRQACDPSSARHEEEADAMAVDVLARLLPAPPYRERVFSERGSMYWNVDRLSLSADAWQRSTLERETMDQGTVHPAFVPTEFPTPPSKINANSKRFMCDVLTKRKGIVLHPLKSVSHPPLEQRLRRIAEVLRPIAEGLPATGAAEEFKPIARLQEGVSPILLHMYRETGVYLEKLHDRICTMANAPTSQQMCN